MRGCLRIFAGVGAICVVCTLFAACDAGTPIADPRGGNSAQPPGEHPEDKEAVRLPFEFKGSFVEARWRAAVKDVPTWRADPAACRAYCEDWCPRAAECLIGPFSQIGRCKALCLDPCNEGLWPAQFAGCARDAKDCNDLRECTRDLREVFDLNSDEEKDSGAKGDSGDGR